MQVDRGTLDCHRELKKLTSCPSALVPLWYILAIDHVVLSQEACPVVNHTDLTPLNPEAVLGIKFGQLGDLVEGLAHAADAMVTHQGHFDLLLIKHVSLVGIGDKKHPYCRLAL